MTATCVMTISGSALRCHEAITDRAVPPTDAFLCYEQAELWPDFVSQWDICDCSLGNWSCAGNILSEPRLNDTVASIVPVVTSAIISDDVSLHKPVSQPPREESSSSFPSQADWQTHLPLITRLYSDQKKSLSEVKAYMEEHHCFYASDNMYKKRIRKWGICKKFKKHEAIAMLAILDKSRSRNVEIQLKLRGKFVDHNDLERYARRANLTMRERFSVHLRDAYRIPGLEVLHDDKAPQVISAPEKYQRFEILHYETKSYFDAAVALSMCYTDKKGYLRWRNNKYNTTSIWSSFYMGISKFRCGRESEAVGAWRTGFLLVEQLIKIPDPRAWLKYIDIVMAVRNVGALEIAKVLNRHILSLIEQRNGGPEVSCYRLIKALCTLDQPAMIESSSSFRDVIVDAWKAQLPAKTTSAAILQFQCTVPDLVPLPSIEILDAEIALLESYDPSGAQTDELLMLLGCKYDVFEYNSRWTDAREVSAEVARLLSQLSVSKYDPRTYTMALFRMAEASFLLKEYDRAKLELLEFFGMKEECKQLYGIAQPTCVMYQYHQYMDSVSKLGDVVNGDRNG